MLSPKKYYQGRQNFTLHWARLLLGLVLCVKQRIANILKPLSTRLRNCKNSKSCVDCTWKRRPRRKYLCWICLKNNGAVNCTHYLTNVKSFRHSVCLALKLICRSKNHLIVKRTFIILRLRPAVMTMLLPFYV